MIAGFEKDVFPYIGAQRAGDLKASDFLQVARRLEARAAFESAHRVMQNCGQVMRYAVATDRAERNPIADLRGALVPAPERNHAAIVDGDAARVRDPRSRHRPAGHTPVVGPAPFWAKAKKLQGSTINARIEKVATKPAFRSALKERRCLIPMAGYYAWSVNAEDV